MYAEQAAGEGMADAAAPAAGDAGQAAAYLIAQSAALAVQDATDALRNATAIAAAASGTALAQFLATGDSRFLDAVGPSRLLIEGAIADFQAIASASAAILDRQRGGGAEAPGGE